MITPLRLNEKNYSINHDYGFPIQAQINDLVRKKWYECPIPEIGTVIDAGACLGIYSLYIGEFAKKVYAIEPYSKSYEYLQKNVQDNKKLNIKTYNIALAGTRGRRTLYSSYNPQDPSGYSLLPVGKPIEVVKSKTLGELMDNEKIQLVHILKTDIEGLEQEVFSADDFGDYAKRILCITGEYHIQCRNLREVLEYHGFDYSESPRGMYTAIRKVKKVDILLP